MDRLGLNVNAQADVIEANLFPEGRAPLVVCNPPWLPARPSSAIEHAIYDPDSRILRGFLEGLRRIDAGRRKLADSLRVRGASRTAHTRAVAGMDRCRRTESRWPDGYQATSSAAADKTDPLYVRRARLGKRRSGVWSSHNYLAAAKQARLLPQPGRWRSTPSADNRRSTLPSRAFRLRRRRQEAH